MTVDWQPIDTAPLDTRVLLAVRGEVEIGQRANLADPLCFRFDASPGILTTYPRGRGPSHWRPLPALSTEEQP